LQFTKLSGLGHTTTWGLIGDGTLRTVAIGRRRLIILESYLQLLERLQAAPPADARRNTTVPLLGSRRTKQLRVDDQRKESPPRQPEAGVIARSAPA
jgi:hypothetical protein